MELFLVTRVFSYDVGADNASLGAWPAPFRALLTQFLIAQKAAHRITRLRAASKPILNSVLNQLDLGGIFQRIVRPHDFHKAPVARPRLLRHHYPVKRPLLLSNPCQTNRYHFKFLPAHSNLPT